MNAAGRAADGADGTSVPRFARLQAALTGATGDFIEMTTYVTIGAVVAAGLQVLVPRSSLLRRRREAAGPGGADRSGR